MDIQAMFNQTLEKMHEEGKIQSIMEKHVESAINDAVKDAFGAWSPLNKEIEKALKEKININLDDIDIPSYNEVILNALDKLLRDAILTKGLDDFNARMQGLLGSLPQEELKLSELVKLLFKELDNELEDYDYDDYLDVTLIVEPSEYSSNTYHLYLDPNEDVEKYDCKYRIFISNGTISSVKVDAKEKYSADRRYDKVTPRILMEGRMSKLEEELFKAYVHKTKIIVDEDYCETSVSVEELRGEQ